MDPVKEFSELREELEKISEDLLGHLRRLQEVSVLQDPTFKAWQKTCHRVQQELKSEMVRVAVVGPIKSGKSTLVNALLKDDLMKRGAGVVTSFVTRIRQGKALKANIHLKSWEEINREIRQALVLFPSSSWSGKREDFDLRNEEHRQQLEKALRDLPIEKQLLQDTLNPSMVILSSYLKGYGPLRALNPSDSLILTFEREEIHQHRQFAGDDILAVFAKDIALEIETNFGRGNVEIADCQGSDSPNPLHLAMIQDYLSVAHLLIYVISSRTGLRQADFRFLSMIKKMGILDNVLFVVNCDLSEHESLQDMHSVIHRIKEELALIQPQAQVFAFSSLFLLLGYNPNRLPEKDRWRFEQWLKEEDLVAFSSGETDRFHAVLNDKHTSERFSLLLKNQVDRLRAITQGLSYWVNVHQDVLSEDEDKISGISERIQSQQNRINEISAMIERTLDGEMYQIRQKVGRLLDVFFDSRSGPVLPPIVDCIRGFHIRYDHYAKTLDSVGLHQALFDVYQDFRQSLDVFMAEAINPVVIKFIREREAQILDSLQSVVSPHAAMVNEALKEFQSAVKPLGVAANYESQGTRQTMDLDEVKRVARLEIHPATAMLSHSSNVRTEAVLRFGLNSTVSLAKRLIKKTFQSRGENAFQALEHAVKRMKREAERSMMFHLKSYRENLKFQYLFKLADSLSIRLYDCMMDQFRAYQTDLGRITKAIREKELDREKTIELLGKVQNETQALGHRLIEMNMGIDKIKDETSDTPG